MSNCQPFFSKTQLGLEMSRNFFQDTVAEQF